MTTIDQEKEALYLLIKEIKEALTASPVALSAIERSLWHRILLVSNLRIKK